MFKGKLTPKTGHEGPEGGGGFINAFTLMLDGGEWSTPKPGRFTRERKPVPIAAGAGWASGLI